MVVRSLSTRRPRATRASCGAMDSAERGPRGRPPSTAGATADRARRLGHTAALRRGSRSPARSRPPGRLVSPESLGAERPRSGCKLSISSSSGGRSSRPQPARDRAATTTDPLRPRRSRGTRPRRRGRGAIRAVPGLREGLTHPSWGPSCVAAPLGSRLREPGGRSPGELRSVAPPRPPPWAPQGPHRPDPAATTALEAKGIHLDLQCSPPVSQTTRSRGPWAVRRHAGSGQDRCDPAHHQGDRKGAEVTIDSTAPGVTVTAKRK